MTGAKTILRGSWRFYFSENRNETSFVFHRGWMHLILDQGLRSSVIVLLILFLSLSAARLSDFPIAQSVLLAIVTILILWFLPKAAFDLLRERQCTVRIADGMLYIPAGFLRSGKCIPLASIVDVELSNHPFGHVRFNTRRDSVFFVLPRMSSYEAKAMVAVLAGQLSQRSLRVVGGQRCSRVTTDRPLPQACG